MADYEGQTKPEWENVHKGNLLILEVCNSIFLELKYVFISNILTWLRRFTRCNRLGRAQVARHN